MSFAESDLAGLQALAGQELAFELCHSKLAEVAEKIIKAELIRSGWTLEKTHDLQKLGNILAIRSPELSNTVRPLCNDLAEVYFSDRYPGFDLADPDWPKLREQMTAVANLMTTIKSRIEGK